MKKLKKENERLLADCEEKTNLIKNLEKSFTELYRSKQDQEAISTQIEQIL